MKNTDAELAAQPIGYWAGAAHRVIIGYIRGEMSALGLTQPQFWLLRNLSAGDLSTDGQGLTLAELTDRMRAYLHDDDDLESAAADLLDRGLVTRDAGQRLWITEAGRRGHARIKEQGPAIRARIHDGIDDADYVTTLKVLRRMIDNVGGDPRAS
ncbi:MarR family winged helix-turn-helix transcriptional regulator [Nonomuraea candida]|uniref:MarR family winged helix-turn-helix transcriptional regulator n=1 Tax=Nonomuraea candida TaxID=359159 RepID=UPI0005BDD53B|nr:MarR family winged helix-turn-helix transcriptional regulator [Nonomuraea candida]